MKIINLFHKKNKKTVSVKILKTGIIISLVLVVGYFSYKGFKISKIFAETSTSQTISSNLDFNKGAFTNTEISGLGDNAEVQLNSGSGVSGDPWMNPAWKFRKKITFDNSGQTEDLINFPVLVKLDSNNIDYLKTENAGKDIRFTDSDGTTLLSYEIDSWNASGSSYVWVKVPKIDGGSSQDYIYIYYGNNEADDSQNAHDVWSNGYVMVQHLRDSSSSTIVGSTENSYLGNKRVADSPKEIDGKIGKAEDFGSSDYIDLGNILNPGSDSWTVEIWFKRKNTGRANSSILYNKENLWESSAGGNQGTYAWRPHWAWDGGFSFPITLNTWYKHTIVYNHNTQKMYRNDKEVYSRNQTGNIGSNSSHLQIGARGNTSHSSFFYGQLDEMRVSNIARSADWIAASYKSENNEFNTFSSEQTALPSSGTWESNDQGNALDLIWNGGWGDGNNTSSTAFSATVGNVGANSSVTFQIRTAATTSALSEKSYKTIGIANSGTEFTATKSQLDALGLATGTEGRYVQIKATLSSSDGITNPKLNNFTIYYQKDSDGPETNASSIQMKATSSGELVEDSNWTNSDAPYFSWNAASDSQSDLKGYCLYLGTDSNADPATAKGILGTSPVSTAGTDCQFIVGTNNIDFATTASRGNPWLSSSSNHYYFKVKAIDNQNNVYNLGEAASFSFKYDGTAPTNPGGVSAPQNFQNSIEAFTIYWPTSGTAGPSDSDSGIKGYQYKIGPNGKWMGANHVGDGDCDDVITQGTYVLDDNFDTIVPGENTFYLRTLDNACNISSTNVSAILKYSGDAPSEPVNLVVDPSSSDENSFTFSWDAPLTYSGQKSGVSYCYTVNSTPSSINCTWTYLTSLEAGAFATQPGKNTFYVVAKDEAGNINYDAYSSIDFTANTSAPGIARSIDVSDISIKVASNWKLAVSWEEPKNVGSGVEDYKIYRSTSASSCSDSFSSFNLVGTTAGTSYTDTNLNQKTYYYCVKACDSANNCSAVSGTASKYPDGKFVEPAELTSDPSVSGITTKRATISWSTGRTSDSKVAYGKGSNDFYDEEPSNSEQVTDHKIALTSLDPGTQYYYKVKWTDEDGNTGESKIKSFKTDDAPSISSVDASNVGIESVFINFTVKDASAAQIVYGESTSYGGTTSLSTSMNKSTYSARLSGLKDGTIYHYKIILKDSEGEEYEFEDHTFTTLPRPRVTNVRVQQVKNAAQPTVLVSWDTNTEVSSIVTYYPQSDPGSSKDEVDVKLKRGTHQMLIKSLNTKTPYLMVVKGRDKIGNEAVSDTQKFTTASDTRPPQISNLGIEGSSIQKTKEGQASTSQIVVSWNTDESSTSQVEFGEGTGNTYSQRTQEDSNLTYNHLVVISGLTPSKVYHLRVISKDESGNVSRSIDTVTITPKATDNALDLVVGNLRDVFGFLK